MEIIISLIVGLFILAIVWAILKRIWIFIVFAIIVGGISWIIQYGLSLLDFDVPLWLICIFIVVGLGYLGSSNEKKAHKAVAEYFDTYQMGELDDIRVFLDEKSIECDEQLLSEIMNKLLEETQIKEELPGKLWRSTKTEGFLVPVETVHLKI